MQGVLPQGIPFLHGFFLENVSKPLIIRHVIYQILVFIRICDIGDCGIRNIGNCGICSIGGCGFARCDGGSNGWSLSGRFRIVSLACAHGQDNGQSQNQCNPFFHSGFLRCG